MLALPTMGSTSCDSILDDGGIEDLERDRSEAAWRTNNLLPCVFIAQQLPERQHSHQLHWTLGWSTYILATHFVLGLIQPTRSSRHRHDRPSTQRKAVSALRGKRQLVHLGSFVLMFASACGSTQSPPAAALATATLSAPPRGATGLTNTATTSSVSKALSEPTPTATLAIRPAAAASTRQPISQQTTLKVPMTIRQYTQCVARTKHYTVAKLRNVL